MREVAFGAPTPDDNEEKVAAGGALLAEGLGFEADADGALPIEGFDTTDENEAPVTGFRTEGVFPDPTAATPGVGATEVEVAAGMVFFGFGFGSV